MESVEPSSSTSDLASLRADEVALQWQRDDRQEMLNAIRQEIHELHAGSQQGIQQLEAQMTERVGQVTIATIKNSSASSGV